ncbi:response regulator, partial [Desulfovibrio desulfuricans]
MKVLLIDDEKDFVTNLQRFIMKLGYETYVAHDGEEGLNLFYREKPDVVITDIRMPGMDGIEFIRRIKEVMDSSTDVIIITGFSNTDNTIKALKYGVRDFWVFDVSCGIHASKSWV